MDEYDNELAKPQQLGIAVGHNAAFWQALGGLLMFGSVSLIYYCGGVFVSKNGGKAIDSDSPAYDLTFENMNKVLMAIMFMAMLVGTLFSTFSPLPPFPFSSPRELLSFTNPPFRSESVPGSRRQEGQASCGSSVPTRGRGTGC